MASREANERAHSWLEQACVALVSPSTDNDFAQFRGLKWYNSITD